MLERLLIAGSGGQGIVLTGKLLATAAVRSVPHVTFYPAYGAEVRGGTSSCQVIMSTGEISSPVVDELDTVILMNQASADRFLPRHAGSGLIFINSALCNVPKKDNISGIPATRLANDMGDICVANFIMLGAYLARRPLVSPAAIEDCTAKALSGKPPALVELNIKAFRTGLAL